VKQTRVHQNITRKMVQIGQKVDVQARGKNRAPKKLTRSTKKKCGGAGHTKRPGGAPNWGWGWISKRKGGASGSRNKRRHHAQRGQGTKSRRPAHANVPKLRGGGREQTKKITTCGGTPALRGTKGRGTILVGGLGDRSRIPPTTTTSETEKRPESTSRARTAEPKGSWGERAGSGR